MRRLRFPALAAAAFACACAQNPTPDAAGDDLEFDAAFVSVAELDSTIVVEARYFGEHNFIGRPIDGYDAPKCLLTREAADALVAVQSELRTFGLGLKTYDCYRPQRAVDHFVRWAADPADTLMKAEFYPTLDKSRLFELGYIAERSGHTRGSTIDLTIIPLPPPEQPAYRAAMPLVPCTAPAGRRFGDNTLDMGTGYDCFHDLAHTANPAVAPVAKRNRLLLKALMEKHGFVNYDREWWHYTLRDEPYPDTYFDEPVR